MKILFVDNSLWSLLHFRGRVIETLLQHGHEVVLAAPYESIPPSMLISQAKIKYTPKNRTNLSLIGEIRYIKMLYSLIKETKPDKLCTYTLKPTLYGNLIARLRKIPTISMLAGLGQLFQGSSLIYRIARGLMYFSLKSAFKIVLLNKEDESVLLKKFSMGNRIITLRGGEGLDVQYYKPASFDASLKVGKIVMIGRILYSKGYLQYVEAAKTIKQNHPDIEFLLAGSLDEGHPDSVPRSVLDLDAKKGYINYIGTVDNVRDFLNDIDVFVLPSFYNEGMNRSLMEAIAMGKLVISTDHKGCREMIHDGKNGFLIPPKDSIALEKAILKVIDMSPLKRKQMGTESRKIAEERFSDINVINLYANLIEDQ